MTRKSKIASIYPTRGLSAAVDAAEIGERSIIKRRGKPVAAVVTLDDCEFLERVVKRLEDEIDLAAVRRSIKRKEKGIPLDKLLKKYGLQ
jgi:antitoxin (DNA-binding transcriptional repressor) of toxin-antitoxin stability system